jgi:adenylate kinase
MIIYGKTGSGKSHFLKFLMREINKHHLFDFGIVMINTSWKKGSFDYVSEKYILKNFDENNITNLIKIQKDNLPENIEKSSFFILDNYITENEIKSNIINKLAIMGRYYNITSILTIQYIHLLPLVLRANSHYNMFFK